MQRYVVAGAGAHGRVVSEAWRAQRPAGEHFFADDDPARIGALSGGVLVKGTIAECLELGEMVIALGSNPLRLEVAERIGKTARWGTVVHPAASVAGSARIGPGCMILAGALVNTDASLGAHVIVNTGAIIEHDCVLEDGANVSPGACMGGRVHIGRGAFVSTGATIAPRVRLGAYSVVGAGAVVVADVPERVLVLGVPARIVRTIDDSFDWGRLL